MTSYLALVVAAGLMVAPVRAESRSPTEYEVKAAFIYNFARYIQWPKGSDANKPFVIGVIGKDPFGFALDDAVRGQTVQGRPVAVTRFERIDDIINCDILFVCSSESGHLQQIFLTLRKAPVLTIGDMNEFAELGGMINLINENNRIRFEINPQAIGRVGLKAGSQVLRLAKIVNETRLDR